VIIIYFICFFLAGVSQEILIVLYHRAITTHRILMVSLLSSIIAAMGLLIFTEVTRKIFDPTMQHYSLGFVIVYALGKGLGSYICMKWLIKKWTV